MSRIMFSSSNISCDSLSDNAIVELVYEARQKNQLLELENQLLETFLLTNDPTIIKNMTATLETACKLSQMDVPDSVRTNKSVSSQWMLQSSSSGIQKSTSGSISSGTTKIGITFCANQANFYFRVDLVEKLVENICVEYQKYLAEINKRKKHIKFSLQALDLDLDDVTELQNKFQKDIVTGAIDSLTNRIPGDRLTQWLIESLYKFDARLSCLRLKLERKRKSLTRVTKRLHQNKDISEQLRPVDVEIEKIHKENKVKELAFKYASCRYMNKFCGNAALMLVIYKKVLEQQEEEKDNIIFLISQLKSKIVLLRQEEGVVASEVFESKDRFDEIKNLCDNYTVPSLIEYAKKINELDEVKKNIKIWERKVNIQRLAIKSGLVELRRKTGLRKPLIYDNNSDTLSFKYHAMEEAVDSIERNLTNA